MIALLGRGLVLAALAAAVAGALLGFAAGFGDRPAARRWTFRLAWLFFWTMLGANLLMEAALLLPDFSVSYVARVGSRSVPAWVQLVSLWSSLEGSILFWGFILGAFVALLAWRERARPGPVAPLALGTLLAVGTFFAFLIAGPANPFGLVWPPPPDGPGPNPLLQNHVLMVVHPPFLYLGYVGMSVPFALAAAALLTGRFDRELLRPLRFWLLVAWTFLTIGIVLGGWWAYEVLGWGGYWAWDPVENASLLPWLTATAALHSLLVVERRGVLKGWSLTLVFASFLLTILGTFMTRSGVFNSVHAFSQSDIGPTILVFLAASLLFSVFLLAARIGTLAPENPLDAGASREGAFLVNNLLLVTLTLTVLLGTVFPLIVEAVKGARISVGEPYFNRMAVPLGVALLFLMGVGPALPWGRAAGRAALASLIPAAGAGLAAAGIGWLAGARSAWLLVSLAAAGFALEVTVRQLLRPALAGRGAEGLGRALFGSGRRRFGSYVVHAGVIVMLVGVAASSSGKLSTEVTLNRGQSAQLGPYRLSFLGTDQELEPHRQAVIARFAVERDGEALGELSPRMNYYMTMREPVGTPAVRTTARGDLYLSLMSVDPHSGRAGVRAFFNPLVAWLWIGGGIVVLGALLALSGGRRQAAPLAEGRPAPVAQPKEVVTP